MKEFMFIFRQPDINFSNVSPEEMQSLLKKMAGLGRRHSGAGKNSQSWITPFRRRQSAQGGRCHYRRSIR